MICYESFGRSMTEKEPEFRSYDPDFFNAIFAVSYNKKGITKDHHIKEKKEKKKKKSKYCSLPCIN